MNFAYAKRFHLSSPRLTTLALLAALVGCAGGGANLSGAPAVPNPNAPLDAAAIHHVVIIVQENRSFDNLFHGFPGADTASSGQTSTGTTVPLQPVPLEAGTDVCHSHFAFYEAYHNGRNDQFDQEQTCGIVNGVYGPTGVSTFMYAYVPQAEISPYFDLATRYTLADRMFQSNSGPSYPAHQYLIAAQSANADDVPSSSPWGCDAPPGTTVPILLSNGMQAHGPFPCFDYSTLGDELDAKGLSWRYYVPALNTVSGSQFTAYDAIRHIRYGPDWTSKIISPETQVLTDIQAGTLANVTWVIPSFPNSDHPLAASNTGPQWVSSVVNTIGASPFWSSTVIFILWDDWGGWYDHVVPQQLDVMGLGFRVPMLVVSPYAKHGYVSHAQHEAASILKFTEDVFGLPSLGQADVRADDLGDCFDFSQVVKPLAPLRTRLSPSFFIHEPHSHVPPDPD